MTRSSVRDSHYDTVIVGARLAAPPPPCSSPAMGIKSCWSTSASVGSDTLSTHALLRGGVLQLHRWGLLDAVISAGTPPIHSARFLYPEPAGSWTFHSVPRPACRRSSRPCRTVLDSMPAAAAQGDGVEARGPHPCDQGASGPRQASHRRGTGGGVPSGPTSWWAWTASAHSSCPWAPQLPRRPAR